jgi:hypothetical protein
MKPHLTPLLIALALLMHPAIPRLDAAESPSSEPWIPCPSLDTITQWVEMPLLGALLGYCAWGQSGLVAGVSAGIIDSVLEAPYLSASLTGAAALQQLPAHHLLSKAIGALLGFAAVEASEGNFHDQVWLAIQNAISVAAVIPLVQRVAGESLPPNTPNFFKNVVTSPACQLGPVAAAAWLGWFEQKEPGSDENFHIALWSMMLQSYTQAKAIRQFIPALGYVIGQGAEPMGQRVRINQHAQSIVDTMELMLGAILMGMHYQINPVLFSKASSNKEDFGPIEKFFPGSPQEVRQKMRPILEGLIEENELSKMARTHDILSMESAVLGFYFIKYFSQSLSDFKKPLTNLGAPGVEHNLNGPNINYPLLKKFFDASGLFLAIQIANFIQSYIRSYLEATHTQALNLAAQNGLSQELFHEGAFRQLPSTVQSIRDANLQLEALIIASEKMRLSANEKVVQGFQSLVHLFSYNMLDFVNLNSLLNVMIDTMHRSISEAIFDQETLIAENEGILIAMEEDLKATFQMEDGVWIEDYLKKMTEINGIKKVVHQYATFETVMEQVIPPLRIFLRYFFVMNKVYTDLEHKEHTNALTAAEVFSNSVSGGKINPRELEDFENNYEAVQLLLKKIQRSSKP